MCKHKKRGLAWLGIAAIMMFILATSSALAADDYDIPSEEVIAALGPLMEDLVYSPVPPCRIVDTRVEGGTFVSGESRFFRVYGNTDDQGGDFCAAPRGEPSAVVINMTVVPAYGQGNFVAFAADLGSGPFASHVNYKAGVQSLANAVIVETAVNTAALPDIAVLNRSGKADLVIDVLGYFYPQHIAKAFGNSVEDPTGVSADDGCQNITYVDVYASKAGQAVIEADAVLWLKSHWLSASSDELEVFLGKQPDACLEGKDSLAYQPALWAVSGRDAWNLAPPGGPDNLAFATVHVGAIAPVNPGKTTFFLNIRRNHGSGPPPPDDADYAGWLRGAIRATFLPQ